jgi:hypothetical protein
MKEQSGFKVFRKSKSKKQLQSEDYVSDKKACKNNLQCFGKTDVIVICITKKKKQNTSRSSAIVTLSENLNSETQNRTKKKLLQSFNIY